MVITKACHGKIRWTRDNFRRHFLDPPEVNPRLQRSSTAMVVINNGPQPLNSVAGWTRYLFIIAILSPKSTDHFFFPATFHCMTFEWSFSKQFSTAFFILGYVFIHVPKVRAPQTPLNIINFPERSGPSTRQSRETYFQLRSRIMVCYDALRGLSYGRQIKKRLQFNVQTSPGCEIDGDWSNQKISECRRTEIRVTSEDPFSKQFSTALLNPIYLSKHDLNFQGKILP